MKTWKGVLVYSAVVVLIQPGLMYFLLRALGWRFFVSAPLAVLSAGVIAEWVVRHLGYRSAP